MPKNKKVPAISFDQAVEKYKKLEKKVADTFIDGVISLGYVLSEQKKIWKPARKWEEYLEAIDKSLAGANQFIRVYEYAQKHLDDLLNSKLTNWSRLNSFLALPEDLREQLSTELKDKEVTNDIFAKEVKELQPEIDLDDQPLDPIGMIDHSIENNIDSRNDAFIEQLKINNEQVTDNSKEISNALLHLGICLKKLRDPKTTKKLTIDEKIFWNNVLKKSIKELKGISSELNTQI